MATFENVGGITSVIAAMERHETATNVLINGCGVIWVASQTTTGCAIALRAGALELIHAVVQQPLFRPMVVGQRDPFRYKLRIAECAQRRLEQGLDGLDGQEA